MRRALFLALVLLLAGCGGGKKAATTAPATTALSTTTTSGDPGRDAVDAAIAVARAGNPDALWGLLSGASRKRLGPTAAAFRNGKGAELVDLFAGLGTGKPVVSERITPEFGIVAVPNGRSVYAVPLRLEGTRWKLELGGAVRVRPLGPDPGAVEPVVAQIAAAVEGPGGAGTAVLYLDGRAENPQVRGTATNATLFANFEPPLGPGRHTVVVFATDGREAGAAAWAFTVRR